MALVLVELGLGWTDFAEAGPRLLIYLLGALALGAGIYVIVVAGAWVALGRPGGAGADLF